MNKTTAIIVGLVLIIVSFYGGMKYGASKNLSVAQGGGSQLAASGSFGSRGMRGGQFGSGNAVSGQIISKDAQSLTIQLRSGGSKIVWYASSTEVQKMVSGSGADLAQGQEVMAMGQANSDGSIAAKSIQIRPNVDNFGNNRQGQ